MRLALAVITLVGAACSKDEGVGVADRGSSAAAPAPSPPSSQATKPVEGLDQQPPTSPKPATGGPRDQLAAAWKTGGLDIAPFAPADVKVGKDCATTTVSNLDILVCVYASPADAKAAEPAALDWVGPTTGTAQLRGATLITIADRGKSDPHGKTINQLIKLAP